MQESELLQVKQRRQPHIFRWVFLTTAVLFLSGVFVVFKWGKKENTPPFVKVWKLRGNVLVSQIKYGQAKPETIVARTELLSALLRQAAYASAEKQYRVMLTDYQRAHGTNNGWSLPQTWQLGIAECRFLQGRKTEAAPLMRVALKRITSLDQWSGFGGGYGEKYPLPVLLAELGRREEAISLAQFEREQALETHKDEPEVIRRWEASYQRLVGRLGNAPSARFSMENRRP